MARRRKGRGGSDPQYMDERWAVSYLDMMTVLFLTFVVLFSMSSIDAGKYEVLKNSLATGFGQEATELEDFQEHLAQPAAESATPPPGPVATQPRTAEEKLEAIEAGVQDNLAELDRKPAVEFAHVDGTLVIRILSGETMFTPDQAELSDSAVKLLGAITPVIRAEGGTVSVEGHADYVQPEKYDSNWELSADRAVQVLRHMVEKQGMAPSHVSATGFGDARPIDGNRDMLDRNRRVDIVVMAKDDPDAPAQKQGAADGAEARSVKSTGSDET